MKLCKSCIFFFCLICISATITTIIYINLNFPIEHIRVETTKATSVVNVLIISYSRSGSSLLGEILSSINNSSYLFEPFHYLCKYANNYTCDSKSHRNSLAKMFNCDGDILHELVHYSFTPVIRQMNNLSDPFSRSPSQLSEQCHRDRIHVIKTLNVSVEEASELIEAGIVPNLRVVHLLRDPRARYYSLQRGGIWSKKEKSVDNLCQRMVRDLVDSKHVPAHLYTRVRYEDVVRNPDQHINTLFNRLYDQNYENETAVYIQSHLQNNELPKPKNIVLNFFNYFRTDKKENNSLEKWKQELSQSTIDKIENKCADVLSEIKYL